MRSITICLFALFVAAVFAATPIFKDGVKQKHNGLNNHSGDDVYFKTKELITENKVMVFSKSYCPFCKRAKELLRQNGVEFFAYELDVESDGASVKQALVKMTSQTTVPNIFISGQHIGGFDKLSAFVKKNNGADFRALLEQ